jgi:hypothetical protein
MLRHFLDQQALAQLEQWGLLRGGKRHDRARYLQLHHAHASQSWQPPLDQPAMTLSGLCELLDR